MPDVRYAMLGHFVSISTYVASFVVLLDIYLEARFPPARLSCHRLELVFGDLATTVFAFKCPVVPFNVMLGQFSRVSVVDSNRLSCV